MGSITNLAKAAGLIGAGTAAYTASVFATECLGLALSARLEGHDELMRSVREEATKLNPDLTERIWPRFHDDLFASVVFPKDPQHKYVVELGGIAASHQGVRHALYHAHLHATNRVCGIPLVGYLLDETRATVYQLTGAQF